MTLPSIKRRKIMLTGNFQKATENLVILSKVLEICPITQKVANKNGKLKMKPNGGSILRAVTGVKSCYLEAKVQ